jgi:hypothetical protein
MQEGVRAKPYGAHAMNINIQTARVLEYMPRILQLLVSLKTSNLQGASLDLLELNSLSQFTHIDVTKVQDCYLPPIGILESNVTVLAITPGRIAYSLDVPLIGVGEQDEVHLKATQYLKLRDSKLLTPWQTSTHYTPTILRYKVIEYDRSLNKGVAIISGPPAPLILVEEGTQLMLEYQIQDVGAKVTPIVDEAYVVR